MIDKYMIKRILFSIIWILLVVIIFTFSIIQQLFNSTVKDVIGKTMWYCIYMLLPILVLMTPLIARHILKCRNKLILICSICVIMIYSLVVFVTPIITYKYIQNFTPQKWAVYKYERKLMLDDLNKNYTLLGMTIEDIKKILGKPDTESENELEYVIDSGWIDPEMLVLRFEEQKVVDIYTYIEFKP